MLNSDVVEVHYISFTVSATSSHLSAITLFATKVRGHASTFQHTIKLAHITKLALSNENMPAFSTSSTLRFRRTRTKDCGFFSRWLI